MRKLLFLTLALLVLGGCGTPVPEVPEPPPEEPPAEEALSLPETWQLEPLSAPGIVSRRRAGNRSSPWETGIITGT